MTEIDKGRCADALTALGIEPTDNMIEQMGVMAEALLIFEQRDSESAHGGLWRQYGAGDTAFHLKSKALRAVNNPLQLDDSFDAINYAAFTIRNVREGRL